MNEFGIEYKKKDFRLFIDSLETSSKSVLLYTALLAFHHSIMIDKFKTPMSLKLHFFYNYFDFFLKTWMKGVKGEGKGFIWT